MAKIIQALEWDEIRVLKPRDALDIYIHHSNGEPAEEILGNFVAASQNADERIIHLSNILNFGEDECKVKTHGHLHLTENTIVSKLNEVQRYALLNISNALTMIRINRKGN